MSSTSQLTTFSDLYTDLENRARVAGGQTATETQAKRYINIALHDMHLGTEHRWPWSERTGRLITQDDYQTGTVSISQGSTTLTGSGTAWNTANSFGVTNARTTGKILLGNTIYRISSVDSDTQLTLTSRFTEASLTASGYYYFEDEYALASDFLHPVSQSLFATNMAIEFIGRNEFYLRYPRSRTLGKPAVATIVDAPASGNNTPIRRVRFFPIPNDFYSIEYTYISQILAISSLGVGATDLSADTDVPIVPLRYRHALVFHALYHWYRDKKDDARSQEAKAEYSDIMMRVMGDTEIGDRRPQLRPRISHYAARAMRPYSYGGRAQRRWDFNGAFDRME